MLFSRNFRLLSIFALMVAAPQVLCAAEPVGDSTITSKRYVDNKIPADSTAHLLVTPQASGGNATKRAITTAGANITGLASSSATGATNIPTAYAVKEAIGSATSGMITDVSGKQDKDNNEVYKVGYNGGWANANTAVAVDTTYLKKTDNTDGSVKVEVDASKMTTSGTSGLSTSSTKLVQEKAIADALALKQQKITHSSTNKVVITPTTNGGATGTRDITTAGANITGLESASSSGATNIPTAYAVKEAIGSATSGMITDVSGKQDKDNNEVYKVGYNGGWANASNAVTVDTTYLKKTDNSTNGTTQVAVDSSKMTTSGTSGLSNSSTKLVQEKAIAQALALKQNKLPYDATPNLIIAPTTDGGEATKRAITTAGANITNLASSSDEGVKNIPTAWAVREAITSATNAADISGHTVNGAPLSNEASYFFGTSETAANTATKVVNIPSITSAPTDGMTIVVMPTYKATAFPLKINLNNTGAVSVVYNSSEVNNSTTANKVWRQNIPSVFVYKANAWVFAGIGYNEDTNTTYSTITQAEIDAGTSTNTRVVTPKLLVDNFQKKTTAVTHGVLTKVGSATKGVYVNANGSVSEMTYELNKTVPSTALFTDTITTVKNSDGTDGASTAADGSVQVTKDGTTTYPVVQGWASKENVSNKVKQGTSTTSIFSNTSTDDEYPSAKAVYTALNAQSTDISGKQDKDNNQIYKVGYNGDWTDLSTAVTVDTTYLKNSNSSNTNKSVQVAIDTSKMTTSGTSGLSNSSTKLVQEKAIANALALKQDKLVAGTNITIASDGKTISATDTTYDVFDGASADAAGSTGLVPAPAKGDQTKFLRADGTWVVPTDTNTTYDTMSVSEGTTGTATTKRVVTAKNLKDTIQGTKLTGIDTSTTGAVVATDTITTGIGKLQASKQDKLTPGSNITINGNTISATDTRYDVFTGANGTTAGTSGLVKAPAATDNTKFLKGDGTWGTPTNTTYSVLSQTNLDAGTETTGRLVSAKLLRDNFYTETETDDLLDDKQNKDTAVTHTASTAVGSTKKPVYIAADGTATEIGYTIEKSVPANAVFTDTTYSAMTSSELTTGTSTTGRLVTPKLLHDELANKQNKDTAVTHTASTAVGSTKKPVYIASDGTATEIGYTIEKSVPANAVFTDTTYDVFDGASADAAGSTGLVPAPAKGDQAKFLRADGTWVVPTNTTYSTMAQSDITNSTTTGKLTTGKLLNDNYQKKETAVTHTASTAVGSATKGVYVKSDGTTAAMTHSVNADVPSTAEFTDTTYSFATGSDSGTISVTPEGGSAYNVTVKDAEVTTHKLAQGDATGTVITSSATDTQYPSAKAVYNAITSATNAADISDHTVNGAPLSNEASYYYGTGAGAANTAAKTVTISSITAAPTAGMTIIVNPATTSSVANPTLNLNSKGAKAIKYNNSTNISAADSGKIWTAGVPSVFVYDGTNWVFAGHGYDKDTTYSTMAQSDITNSTTTGKLTTGKLLRDNFYTETETDDLLDEKQDKDTAVTHTANTAVGTQYKGVYVDNDGTVKAMTYSVNANVPSTAEFTDTTYTFATGTTNGAFTVTPEGGSAQTVSIYGWANKQNKPATAEVAAGKVLTYNGTGDANGTNNYSAKYIQVPVANNAPNGSNVTVSTLADIWVE